MVAGSNMATVQPNVINNNAPQSTGTNVANSAETGPTRPRTSDNRRSNKPIMEKRRRARINNCLNELKTLILDAMKKDPARHSKLEKADILEMTVKHLETLQRQQVAMTAASDPGVANKFRAGFTECAGEVGRFPGLDGPVKRRLLQHLANCLNQNVGNTNNQVSNQEPQTTSTTQPNVGVQVHIVRTQPAPEPGANQTSNIIFTNGNGHGLQLVPTRLSNGDIALILPSSNAFRTARTTVQTTPSTSPSPSISSTSSGSSPLPMLIPIPNTSNSPSPVLFDRLSVNTSTNTRQITVLTQNPQRIILPAKETVKNIPLLTTPEHNEPKLHETTTYVEKQVSEPVRIDTNERYVKKNDDEYYRDEQETILHIPEREYTYSYSPNYENDGYESRYENYDYSDEYSRSYSPELQKPLALVTRKKYHVEDDERPWRPW